MSIVTLSRDAATVVDSARSLAEKQKHTTLDSPHLFWALIQQTDVGQEWLDSSGISDAQGFLQDLESAFSNWYETGDTEPEASTLYITVMRYTQHLAAAVRAPVITPAHLLKAVLE